MEAGHTVSTWKSETFRQLLLVAGSLALALGLIEFPALINVIDYQRLEVGGIWDSLRFPKVADPELINHWPPHAHYRGSGFGGIAETLYRIPASERTLFRWDLRFDQMGFRNEADLNSADTIVIGDSMVEGDSVSNNEVATSVLQRLEGKTVANLAQLGYGPQQELICLKRYGLPLRPHTVIWVFSETTDLGDFIGYRRMLLPPPNRWNLFLQRSFSRLAYRQVRRIFAPRKPPGIECSGEIPAPGGRATRVYFEKRFHPLTGAELRAIDGTAGILAEAFRRPRGSLSPGLRARQVQGLPRSLPVPSGIRMRPLDRERPAGTSAKRGSIHCSRDWLRGFDRPSRGSRQRRLAAVLFRRRSLVPGGAQDCRPDDLYVPGPGFPVNR